ncbi:MAG: hypothetical protein ACYTDU_11655 [Planctomycetota bacterium]|jgi:tetratricopeptide (TPR) repeat protein
MRAIWVVLLAAGAVCADDIVMKNGSVIEGMVIESNTDGLKAKVAVADGESVVTLKAEDLDPHFFYNLRAKKVGKDAKERLKLAVYAFENGMFNRARHQYNRALVMDEALVDKFEKEIVPKIKDEVANNLLVNAKEMLKGGDLQRAERSCAKILSELWDTEAAEEARKLLDTCLEKIEKRGKTDRGKEAAKLERQQKLEEARLMRKREAVLGPIEGEIESGRRTYHKGLKTHHLGQAKGMFGQAAKKFERAVKSIDKLESKTDDPVTIAKGKALRQIAVDEGIDAYISQGRVYLTRRAYQDAMGSANRAMALAPDSSRASQFQAEVSTAAQYRSGRER